MLQAPPILASCLIISLAVLNAATSHARPTPEQKCQAGKNLAAGRLAACFQNAEAKLATTGNAAKYTQAKLDCSHKFATKWLKLGAAASRAGATCPDAPLDQGALDAAIGQCSAGVASALSGSGLPPTASPGVTATATQTPLQPTTTPSFSGSPTPSPTFVPGIVFQGALGSATTGRFEFSSMVGLPASDAACGEAFPSSHTCIFEELHDAADANELFGLPDTVFWAIDSSRASAQQCANWTSADSGYSALRTPLVGGRLGVGTSSSCEGTATIGCCLNLASCGNDIIEGHEDCEAGNLGGDTCKTLGYDSGTLACTLSCYFDQSGCHSE